MSTPTTTPTPLRLDLASFLAWAERRGTALDARAAEAVLGLLALSGARRRPGVPEPTEELVEELLHTLLPLYVSATEAELPSFLAAVVALADRTHEAGRLNAKRHARLVARVQELAEGFTQMMTSPQRVTWARLYGNLLRAEGVEAADARAVAAWLEAFAARPYAQRQTALGLAVADGPLAAAGWLRALTGERSRQARSLLAGRLQAVALGEQVRPPSGQAPLIPEAPQGEPDVPQEQEDAWYDAQAGVLSDRWTAAGLDALLRGPYAHLAPGAGSHAPLVGIVGELAAQHLEMFGPNPSPLPPPPLPASPEEQAAQLRAAPLPQALAQAAANPDTADEQVRELALASGFLTVDADGAPFPGPAAEVWQHGGPAELAGLALDLLGALLAQLAEDEETAEEFPGEHLGPLYFLYQQAGVAQSVARQAAQEELWIVPLGHQSAPDASVPATGPYELPAPEALSAVTGIPALNEADREDLQPAAARLARVMDRLAGLGIAERTGDALTLTPLGSALLRDALLLGAGGADDGAFPTQAQVRTWAADLLVAAAQHWPPTAARQVLGDWLTERGADGWPALLAALAATRPGPDAADRRALLGLLDLTAAPAHALHAQLADPVLGGHAERALRERGLTPDASAVPSAARAVLLLDELEAVRQAASLTHRLTAAFEQHEPELPVQVQAAFDKAAADWPGGGPALLTALADADPYQSAFLAQQLTHHPDPANAEAARQAWRAYRSDRNAALTSHPRKAKPNSQRKRPAAKRSAKKRKRR
ncbi:hypothetical protein [Streptomyces sp. CA-106131]|uniref:hypothetical protein n=1 Tax=Streptomyces sp. CA-106131 TaxID=3240045 RepID=UPI003D8A47D0